MLNSTMYLQNGPQVLYFTIDLIAHRCCLLLLRFFFFFFNSFLFRVAANEKRGNVAIRRVRRGRRTKCNWRARSKNRMCRLYIFRCARRQRPEKLWCDNEEVKNATECFERADVIQLFVWCAPLLMPSQQHQHNNIHLHIKTAIYRFSFFFSFSFFFLLVRLQETTTTTTFVRWMRFDSYRALTSVCVNAL